MRSGPMSFDPFDHCGSSSSDGTCCGSAEDDGPVFDPEGILRLPELFVARRYVFLESKAFRPASITTISTSAG
jgi:hypothetical protein